jgi:hypothetical protein
MNITGDRGPAVDRVGQPRDIEIREVRGNCDLERFLLSDFNDFLVLSPFFVAGKECLKNKRKEKI